MLPANAAPTDKPIPTVGGKLWATATPFLPERQVVSTPLLEDPDLERFIHEDPNLGHIEGHHLGPIGPFTPLGRDPAIQVLIEHGENTCPLFHLPTIGPFEPLRDDLFNPRQLHIPQGEGRALTSVSGDFGSVLGFEDPPFLLPPPLQGAIRLLSSPPAPAWHAPPAFQSSVSRNETEADNVVAVQSSASSRSSPLQRSVSRGETEAGNVPAVQSSSSSRSWPFERATGLLSSPPAPATFPADAIHRAGRPTGNAALQEAGLAGSIELVHLLLAADPRTSVTYPVLVRISATAGPAPTEILCMLVCHAVRWGWAEGWTKVELFGLFVTVRSLGGHRCPGAKLLGLRMRKVWGKEMMALLGYKVYHYQGRGSVGMGR